MEKLKVAIIGTGQIVTSTHMQNILLNKNAEVAAICDINKQLVRTTAKEFSIERYYTNYKTMLKEVKPDAALICVPNKYHYQTTIDCLNSHCHVLCEKPPAISYREAKHMEEMAAGKGLLLSYGFHFRHSKKMNLLKNKIDQGEFGQIYSAKAVWHRKRGVPGWGSFIDKDLQGGGPLIDLGSHMLDSVFYLLNYKEISYICANTSDLLAKKSQVYLMGEYDKSKYTVEDCLFGFIMFKDNSSLIIETSFALNMKDLNYRNITLMGDRKGATLYPLEIFGEENGELVDVKYDSLEIDESLHLKSVSNFISSCLGYEELLVTAQQGTYVQNVLDNLYKSAALQKPITFP